MPRLDRTGPQGVGARTGRGMGSCGGGSGFQMGCDRGFRRGVGGGRVPIQMTSSEETRLLTEDAKMMEEQIKLVKGRLAELKDK
jgi:hypothetical protein